MMILTLMLGTHEFVGPVKEGHRDTETRGLPVGNVLVLKTGVAERRLQSGLYGRKRTQLKLVL